MAKKKKEPSINRAVGEDVYIAGAGITQEIPIVETLRQNYMPYAMSVIVSVVAENTVHVLKKQDIAPEIVRAQMDAIYEDIGTDAVKIGMLPTPEVMSVVAEKLCKYRPKNVVVDPVMYAKDGTALMDPRSIETFKAEILPLADVLTPNIPEAEEITGMHIETEEDMRVAAKLICTMGCKAVLVKGGHFAGDPIDILFDGEQYVSFTAKRIQTKNTHGTGCTLSSAIASNLALEYAPAEAVKRAKDYMTCAIEHALELGHGAGPTNHFYSLYQSGLPK